MTLRNCLLKSIIGNLRRNFWMTILFFLVFFAAGPVLTLVSLDGAKHTAPPYPGNFNLKEYLQWTFCQSMSLSNSMTILLVVVSGILAGFAGFFYLYSQEKTDFYHSLPLKREKLFAVQYVSGVLIFLIPYLMNTLIVLVIGGLYSALDPKAFVVVGMQALFGIIYFLAAYGMGILAVLLTGNLFGGILGVIGLLTYGPVLYVAYTRMNYKFFNTLASELETGLGQFFSPVTAYLQAARLYGQEKDVTVYLFYGLFLTVILIFIDMLVYHFRPSESFQRTISFKKLEPVIKVCGLLPLILLAAMFFSSGMYDWFFWMTAGALVLTLILSAIYDFLCTMDIRRAVKPKISTGVILVGIVLILGGYQMDITGVDSFLPKEEKIASMSVYFNSINGQFGYPENTKVSAPADFLKENQIKEFKDIYALAEKGVQYYKQKGTHDQRNSQDETEEADQTMVSCYIGYHLKSGRDVYRVYYLPESEELVENIGKIYDNWEYRQAVLPTSYIDPEKIKEINTFSFLEAGKSLKLTENSADTLMKTYKGELENLTFSQSRQEKVTGYMEIQENAQDNQGYHSVYTADSYMYSYCLPIYESFEKTRDLLGKMGNQMPDEIPADTVESIGLSGYVSSGGEELFREKIFQDQEEIGKILKQITYTQGRYTVGSSVDADIIVDIQWKDPESSPVSLYLMEDSSLSDILEKLYQQNTD